MSKQVTIGLVVPFAEDKVPPEGHQMYPGMTFLPRGVGVRSLTPEGFTAAFDAIPSAADYLVSKLNRSFNDIMTSADTKAHFTRLGWEPVVSTPAELGDYIKSEVTRWGKVLQAAGAVGIE